MDNHAVPNYKKSHPLVITLRISRHSAKTWEKYIRKWRLEQGLRQKDMAKIIGVNEMTIVNWETGKTKPTKSNVERLKLLIDFPDGLEMNLPNGRR